MFVYIFAQYVGWSLCLGTKQVEPWQKILYTFKKIGWLKKEFFTEILFELKKTIDDDII